jgi:hypothetical protein
MAILPAHPAQKAPAGAPILALTRGNARVPGLCQVRPYPARYPAQIRLAPRADVRYSRGMTEDQRLAYLPTADERLRIQRASAHALPPHLLTEDNAFQLGVTELDMARILEALEKGVEFRRNKFGRWFAPPAYPKGFRVSTVIAEGVRTGLVQHVIERKGRDVVHRLLPAPVHQGVWNDQRASWDPECGEAGHGKGPKRTRVHRDPEVVDCARCLARL